MTHWAEPKDFREWTRRSLSVRSLILLLMILCLLISELRFDWIEDLLGNYLAATNSHRPESGTIWEIGHQTTVARQTLDKLITDRQTNQREARDAENFAQIAENIQPGQGIILSPDAFRKLYLTLPPEISDRMVSPYKLLSIYSGQKWDRTVFEKEAGNLLIHFLDTENRVLYQLIISGQTLRQIKEKDFSEIESLEDIPGFANRIYDAQTFFSKLNLLPEDVRRGVLPDPEVVLKWSGRITRVGISDEIGSDYIEIGFEIENTKRRVLITRGHEWAVWYLRSRLEEDDYVDEIL